MNADQEKKDDSPTAEDVKRAYDAYRAAKKAYLDVLARCVRAQPEEVDPLFIAFAKEKTLLRVLHALSVGYGLSEEIYKVASRAQIAQAQLRGFVTREELHGGIVLTEKGAETFRQWTEYMVPLRDAHPRYQELWQIVTGLEG